jgi:hypothetical protein
MLAQYAIDAYASPSANDENETDRDRLAG